MIYFSLYIPLSLPECQVFYFRHGRKMQESTRLNLPSLDNKTAQIPIQPQQLP